MKNHVFIFSLLLIALGALPVFARNITVSGVRTGQAFVLPMNVKCALGITA